jgi:hypothetical protein
MHTIVIHTTVHMPDPNDPQAWEAVDVSASAQLAPNPFFHLHHMHPDATDCEPPFAMQHFMVLLPCGHDIAGELEDFDESRILGELQEAYYERVAILQ